MNSEKHLPPLISETSAPLKSMKRNPSSAHTKRASKQKESQSHSLHTSGPWLYEDRCLYFLNDTPEGRMNRWSASIQAGFTENGERPSAEELEANLRLMSAAPELLKELQRVLMFFGADEEAGLLPHGFATFNGARAAITKALQAASVGRGGEKV